MRGPALNHLPDTGCSLHSACLTCPFAVCRYDAGGHVAVQTEVITAAKARGLSVTAIAGELGVGRRTVFRHLAMARQAR